MHPVSQESKCPHSSVNPRSLPCWQKVVTFPEAEYSHERKSNSTSRLQHYEKQTRAPHYFFAANCELSKHVIVYPWGKLAQFSLDHKCINENRLSSSDELRVNQQIIVNVWN